MQILLIKHDAWATTSMPLHFTGWNSGPCIFYFFSLSWWYYTGCFILSGWTGCLQITIYVWNKFENIRKDFALHLVYKQIDLFNYFIFANILFIHYSLALKIFICPTCVCCVLCVHLVRLVLSCLPWTSCIHKCVQCQYYSDHPVPAVCIVPWGVK